MFFVYFAPARTTEPALVDRPAPGDRMLLS